LTKKNEEQRPQAEKKISAGVCVGFISIMTHTSVPTIDKKKYKTCLKRKNRNVINIWMPYE